jgi:hypothetical protein
MSDAFLSLAQTERGLFCFLVPRWQALVQAIHHARGRRAFGQRRIDQPLMLQVLADMALEIEAATALALRVARTYDERDDETARLFARGATPIAKFWMTHRAPALTFEALSASVFLRTAPPFVADAYCASRLGGDGGQSFGTLSRPGMRGRSSSARCRAPEPAARETPR